MIASRRSWGVLVACLTATTTAAAKDTYEIVTSKVTYSTADGISIRAEPSFDIDLSSYDFKQPDIVQRFLGTEVVPDIAPKPDPIMRSFRLGENPFELARSPSAEDDNSLSYATTSASIASALLLPEEMLPLITVSTLLADTSVPLAKVIEGHNNETEAKLRLDKTERAGQLQPTQYIADSSGNGAVLLHTVIDHVLSLNSKPIFTDFIIGHLLGSWVGDVMEGWVAPRFHIETKTLRFEIAKEAVGNLAESLADYLTPSPGGGGGGCPIVIAPPGEFAPPVVCPDTLTTEAFPLAAPPEYAPTVPVAAAAAAFRPPPIIAALPAARAITPTLDAHPVQVTATTPRPGTIIYRFRPVAPPRPYPPAAQSPPSSDDQEHEEDWRGLPTGVEVDGPINGSIDIERDQ